MAPEVFVKSYDMLADFFSLGAFIYSLFTNKIPFPSQSRKYFFKTSFHLPESITRLPVGAAELVQGLCAYYERDRLGYDGYWNDVRKHSYFKDYPWDDIAAKSRLSPFRITEEYNFNMRYNLEDTFAFNYEGEKIKLEDAKKIFQMLKGIQYNLDPPFKLSDGTTYLTGSSGAKKVPKPKKKMAPKTPPPDRKDPSKENLRKSKITHLSNLSASSPKMKTEGKSTTDSMGILTPRSVGTHKSALRSSRRSGSNPFTTSPLIKEDKPGIQEIIPEAKT
ncbi:hypothetical protein AAMO2058_000800000 [Amorphochlora amoebiformis]|uniref:Protein kinase domain-containing protein n=1 Tax=Amorphochlora amoebiformis TaxID=1561963 RepID=A0A7S0H771_9EUKA|mmetsp:Transcript_34915/g.56337  ORF Transcript_34915/g.56337 Transcript_34915/m.56337 type:complete len:277 (+) Transcript_34915:307-1137(+)